MARECAGTGSGEPPRLDPMRRQLLEDARRYREEAARCGALAARASDPAIRAQLSMIADTYRKLARQLQSLASLP